VASGEPAQFHTAILKFQEIHTLLTFERFTLKFALFLFMCTTKTPRIDSTTFFSQTFSITIVKRTPKYTRIQLKKVKYFNALPTLNLKNTH